MNGNPFHNADAVVVGLESKPKTGGRRLRGFWCEVGTLGRLVRAWKRGEYPLSTPQIAALLGALGYVISPIDAIPDVIPILGLTDDAAIVTSVVASMAVELVCFRAWEMEQAAMNGGGRS